jgi:type I restriction enzyme S subunit
MIKYVPFSSVLSKVIDNRGRTCPTAATGTPLIATNCVTNNNLYPTYDTVRYVDDETMRTWFRGHPLPGDLLFVLKGTPGRVALVPDPVDFCIAQDMVALRADPNKIYPRYLFAVLRSENIQQEIEGLHVGSLIPHFKKSDFNELKIPVINEKLQEFLFED